MKSKSNFNSYENDKKYDAKRPKGRVWNRSYSMYDVLAVTPSDNLVADISKNGLISGVRL